MRVCPVPVDAIQEQPRPEAQRSSRRGPFYRRSTAASEHRGRVKPCQVENKSSKGWAGPRALLECEDCEEKGRDVAGTWQGRGPQGPVMGRRCRSYCAWAWCSGRSLDLINHPWPEPSCAGGGYVYGRMVGVVVLCGCCAVAKAECRMQQSVCFHISRETREPTVGPPLPSNNLVLSCSPSPTAHALHSTALGPGANLLVLRRSRGKTSEGFISRNGEPRCNGGPLHAWVGMVRRDDPPVCWLPVWRVT